MGPGDLDLGPHTCRAISYSLKPALPCFYFENVILNISHYISLTRDWKKKEKKYGQIGYPLSLVTKLYLRTFFTAEYTGYAFLFQSDAENICFV